MADGLDHAAFPAVSSLSVESDLVISSQGSPRLMPASLLRGLFSAGPNVTIDSSGVISSTAVTTITGNVASGSWIGELQVVTGVAAQDLVAVSHAGSDCAVTYSNFLGGVTIDQAQTAGPVNDADAIWVAQGSNVMASQDFSAIWVWMAKKLPTYKVPVVEITTNTNLDATIHNGRILICSQPVTLTPLTNNMGSGFQCTVINASTGNITLDTGFVSSNGSSTLLPWQSASLSCAVYSGGAIAFAAMPGAATVALVPGQVTGLSSSGATSTSITVAWQPPSSGGAVSAYVIQYRVTGATSWSSSSPVVSATTYQVTALQPGTSYDIAVEAQNTMGVGAASAIMTVVTPSATQTTVPPQVSGLAANPTSSTAIQLTWPSQRGANAATSFTVQYRVTGSSSWASTVTGITGTSDTISGLQAATSYDFSVIGVNTAGAGQASATVTAVTLTAAQSITSITWNLWPTGTYTHASGSIGVNAHVSPGNAPIQFGFSLSASTPPSSWTAAILVNTDLWGSYVPTPATAGSWYAWAEGLDGSAQTVSPSPFQVQ
ncbi:MAG: fibronectin type III domain-containing protein [Rhodopila sp.]|nr:fibronectin type III domain-containing protein [Rhodopila sp.]